ncbi:anion permease [Sulfurospirillum diekertiae]|uniref:anion permease n=1 Tax=Sulfurospirillum diekertiae TaxID=1854492 RepID=UPI0019310014|nr:anion permease [Sulfurospirillum diekertiae]
MGTFLKQYGLFVSLIILCLIIALPTPEGLTIAGHRMLGLLVFSVILWMTECTSYPVSAAIIITLMVLLLGFAPDMAQTRKIYRHI